VVSIEASVTESGRIAAFAARCGRPSTLPRIAVAPTAPAAMNVAMTIATALPRSTNRLNRSRVAARAA
jgi:hypothetical protein